MSVDPLNSRGIPSTPGRVAGSRSSRRQEPPVEEQQGETPPSSGDSVQLSDASRSLVRGPDTALVVPQGTVSQPRMQEVLRRLADGLYDGAEVRGEVARRAQHDIGLSRPE